MDLIGKYELVRVRLPDGLDKWKTARALERLLDSVCVHQIGFTATLYRCVCVFVYVFVCRGCTPMHVCAALAY
jgi:hypothetical protein